VAIRRKDYRRKKRNWPGDERGDGQKKQSAREEEEKTLEGGITRKGILSESSEAGGLGRRKKKGRPFRCCDYKSQSAAMMVRKERKERRSWVPGDARGSFVRVDAISEKRGRQKKNPCEGHG